MSWPVGRKPRILLLAAALATLLALNWLAFDLNGRVARSGAAIAALADAERGGAAAAQAAPTSAQRRQLMGELRSQLDDELQQLKFAIGGAMAGYILLLLYVVFAYRFDSVVRPVAASARQREPAAAAAALADDMSKLLQSSSDYADAYQVVQRFGAGLFHGCSGALYLAQQPGGRLEIQAQWGSSAGSGSGFASADCWALRRGESHLAADPGAMACRHLPQPRLAPSLCVPVLGQGVALGVLVLEDDAQSGTLARMRGAARDFAGQIGLALANMRLRETLRELSVRDPHTGLFNRSYMEESLQREIAAARRKSRSLAAAICELNQFERFKASFGADAGEFALREIAQLISKHIRSSDIACRYHKDQIALVFPEAPLEGVVMRANQLREAIAALELERFGRRLDKLSASFGVALFPQHGSSAAELLQQAEAALAGAKAFGNNRVQVAETAAGQG